MLPEGMRPGFTTGAVRFSSQYNVLQRGPGGGAENSSSSGCTAQRLGVGGNTAQGKSKFFKQSREFTKKELAKKVSEEEDSEWSSKNVLVLNNQKSHRENSQ